MTQTFVAQQTTSSNGQFFGLAAPVHCFLGKAGVVSADAKREGDMCSPAGTWQFVSVFYRADRLDRPDTALPVRALEPDDGWCDAKGDAHYNQYVKHPYSGSAEHLWRDDGLYDVIVVLDHNSAPVVDDRGSAIFLHCIDDTTTHTAGCIAMPRAHVLALLAQAKPGDAVEIRPAP